MGKNEYSQRNTIHGREGYISLLEKGSQENEFYVRFVAPARVPTF